MSNIKALTRLMQELEDQLVICMRCGMCQAICPLFAETGHEADVARGKLALLEGLMQEMFINPRGVYDRLNKCLLCGSCAANCPSGVNALEIFIKARSIITGYMGLSPAKKLFLRGMLSRPELFDRLAEWGAKFQKIFTQSANELIGTSCARFVSPLLKDRHFVPLAAVPFHKTAAGLDTNPGQSGIKAAFFVGCLIDKIFPKVADSVVDVLNYHGVGIYIPNSQGCCGIPAISSGDMLTFNQLVRHNLKLFDPDRFDYLVTSCATCTATIRKIWPLMVRDDSGNIRDAVARVAEKTLDINQFLAANIGLQTAAINEGDSVFEVTYHDPCHLKKLLGISDEPRMLIKAHPGYRLKEMPESDWCCGLGGTFNLQYYEISANIGKRKIDNIKASGCSVVATGCPACTLQIADTLSKSQTNIAVKHPIEIYADFLKTR